MLFLLKRLNRLFRRGDLGILVKSLVLSLSILLGGSLTVWLLEGCGKGTMFKTYGDAVWWAAVTMTTVGYGDKYPETAAGRAVAVALMVFGIAILGTCLGVIASILVEHKRKEELGLKDFSDLEGHTLICNFALSDKELLESIRHDRPKDAIVIMSPHLKEKPDFFDENTHYVHGKATSLTDLRRTGVEGAKCAIVLFNRNGGEKDADTILAVLGIRSLNRSCYICAELENAENQAHLKNAGANTIISWGSLRNKMFAQEIVDRGVTAVITDLIDVAGEQIEKMRLDAETAKECPTFGELVRHLKAKRNVLVFAVERDGKPAINPDGGSAVFENDFIFCIGH